MYRASTGLHLGSGDCRWHTRSNSWACVPSTPQSFVVKRRSRKPNEVSFFASVAEAVWWLTMLDEPLWGTHIAGEGYEWARDSSPHGSLLVGIRYARNRQVHDTRVTGMQGNPLLVGVGANDGKWRWRSPTSPGVPPYKPKSEAGWGKQGEDIFRDAMATLEVLPTLEDAAEFLNDRIAQLHAEASQQGTVA